MGLLLTAQERPCTRCIKRNIGHLCHDEPRDPVKRSKTEPDPDPSAGDEEASPKLELTPPDAPVTSLDQRPTSQDAGLHLAAPSLPQNRIASASSIAQPSPVSASQIAALTGSNQSCWLHLSRHHEMLPC